MGKGKRENLERLLSVAWEYQVRGTNMAAPDKVPNNTSGVKPLLTRLMMIFLKHCRVSYRENKLDILIIAATILVFGIFGGVNQHWDYIAPVFVAICVILLNHLIAATRALEREIQHETESNTKKYPNYRLRLWGFVGLFILVCSFLCFGAVMQFRESEGKLFVLEYHDHITIGYMVPHVSPLDPSRLQFFPEERHTARMEIDVEIENNLQPVTLIGEWGFVYLEPGVSGGSQNDAIKQANDGFKTMPLANAYQFGRMSPQDKTSFRIFNFPTFDELNKVIKKDDVFYVVGLVVFMDTTGTYEQQFCRAITIRDLPEGKQNHYEIRCTNFNDEMPRNLKLKTFR